MIDYALMNKRLNELDRELNYHAPIFGVYWDTSSDPEMVRTHDAVGMSAAVGTDGVFVQNDFDSAPIWGQMGDVTDTLGNVFVRIPNFYIRKKEGAGFKIAQVTTRPLPGFYNPCCFWNFNRGKSLPYLDYGKYKGSKASTKLQSVADVYPYVNDTIINFRTAAEANNVGGLLGYQQLDIHAIDVLRTLILVEFANLDIQTVMAGFTAGAYSSSEVATADTTDTNTIIVSNTTGAKFKVGQGIGVGSALGNNSIFYGRTITQIDVDTPGAESTTIAFDGATASIPTGSIIYNVGWKNGFSAGIASSSGSLTSNLSGLYPCSWRGIESPFGDIWQFVDGLNITNRQAWICKNADDYASNVFASPYEQIGYVNHNTNGYVQSMGYDANYPFVELPTAITGGTTPTEYYGDYYYQDAGQRIARFGGSWNYGSNAGLSSWALSNSSSSAGVYSGGRLLKKPL